MDPKLYFVVMDNFHLVRESFEVKKPQAGWGFQVPSLDFPNTAPNFALGHRIFLIFKWLKNEELFLKKII